MVGCCVRVVLFTSLDKGRFRGAKRRWAAQLPAAAEEHQLGGCYAARRGGALQQSIDAQTRARIRRLRVNP